MKVGLQVYTVRNHLKANPAKTLEEVAKAGYKGIEFANHVAEKDIGIGFGYTKEEMQKIVKDTGIDVIGAHVTSSDALKTDIYTDLEYFKKIIDYYVALDAKFLSIPQDCYATKDILLRRCQDFDALGKLCKENGITLLYHNHWNEYQQFDGENIIDLLMDNTDPNYLKIELDTYWTAIGLINPVDMIHQYKDRVALLHQKDFPLEKIDKFNAWNRIDRDKIVTLEQFHSLIDPELFTEIGNGVLKIQDYIDAGNEYGVPYILVEQDYSKYDEFESINISMNNFKKMRGLEWD